jgi:small subunit ribosomal protein S9
MEKTQKTKKGKRIKKKIKETKKEEKYYQGVGRRKTAVARVRIFSQIPSLKKEDLKENFLVNGKPLKEYFPTFVFQKIVLSPLEILNLLERFRILARVEGGGLRAQAEAIRHGLAKALVVFNPAFQKRLKKAGYLTRDPRMKERKKFGLKRARRAPQWQKR